jgi:hypothetical protein
VYGRNRPRVDPLTEAQAASTHSRTRDRS